MCVSLGVVAELQAWTMEFRGRVLKASKKNFQLVDPATGTTRNFTSHDKHCSNPTCSSTFAVVKLLWLYLPKDKFTRMGNPHSLNVDVFDVDTAYPLLACVVAVTRRRCRDAVWQGRQGYLFAGFQAASQPSRRHGHRPVHIRRQAGCGVAIALAPAPFMYALEHYVRSSCQ